MKIITVSGSYSNVGKTTIMKRLEKVLPGIKAKVKIGHGKDNPLKDLRLFHNVEDAMAFIKELDDTTDYLLVESNRIHEILKPDLSIFIMGKKNPQKESAEFARISSDILWNNENISPKLMTIVNKQLDISIDENIFFPII